MTEYEKAVVDYLALDARLKELQPAYRGNAFWAKLLAEAKFFKPMPFPRKYVKGKMKLCFMNAYKLAMANPDLTYVEGYACGVIPVHHAWCVDKDGNVVDPTWDDGKAYFGVPCTVDVLQKAAVTYGTYGVFQKY